eukprot:TRINITY_DN803_c0_g1_i1.p1 TRINITY_DN803_c0_g1~~TRINITY_DN803_c0_g1_i1.p1  ORF type:complete len:606 (-),score=-27.20 TRINITY_DN803_c0_g1_i1:35-1852(-)
MPISTQYNMSIRSIFSCEICIAWFYIIILSLLVSVTNAHFSVDAIRNIEKSYVVYKSENDICTFGFFIQGTYTATFNMAIPCIELQTIKTSFPGGNYVKSTQSVSLRYQRPPTGLERVELSILDTIPVEGLFQRLCTVWKQKIHCFSVTGKIENRIQLSTDPDNAHSSTASITPGLPLFNDRYNLVAIIVNNKEAIGVFDELQRQGPHYLDVIKKHLKDHTEGTGCDRLVLWENTFPYLGNKEEFHYCDELLNKQILNPVPKIKEWQNRGINILSLDGGGMRGLSTIAILKDLQHAYGSNFIDSFDLICGTSTGGIISYGLLNGTTLDSLEQFYTDMGPQIFPQHSSSSWTKSVKDTLIKYLSPLLADAGNQILFGTSDQTSVAIENIFNKMVGNLTFAELVAKTSKHGIMVASELDRQPEQPFLFKTYGGRGSVFSGTSDAPLLVALRSTTAAPSYFAPMPYGPFRLFDGGMVANNPTDICYEEARVLCQRSSCEIDHVVSIGTGLVESTKKFSIDTYVLDKDFVNTLTDTQVTHLLMKQRLSHSPTRYFRFNTPDLRRSLDDSSKEALDDINEKVKAYFTTNYYIQQKMEFISSLHSSKHKNV